MINTMKSLLALCLFYSAASVSTAETPIKHTSFRPGEIWTDNRGGKGDLRARPRGPVGGHEQGFPGKHTAKALHKAAFCVGAHLDSVCHPGHAAGLREHALSRGIELNLDGGHGFSYDTILHNICPPFLSAVQAIPSGSGNLITGWMKHILDQGKESPAPDPLYGVR